MRCPACGCGELAALLEPHRGPVHCNVLWETQEQALDAPTGRIELAICETCAMIANVAFDAALAEYSQGYENALHFSGVFSAFESDLARDLAGRHAVPGGRVVEIGCGDGHFLSLVCAEGRSGGIGFDPSQPRSERTTAHGDTVEIVPEVYAEQHAAPDAWLICARHVLEHLADPAAVLTAVGRTMGAAERTALYVEVPDARYMLERGAVWDVIYEHCGYFAGPALTRLLERAGLRAMVAGSSFGGQYLGAEAVVATDGGPRDDAGEVAALLALAREFETTRREQLDRSERTLRELHDDGSSVVLWGAGSKGVTFLNALGAGTTVSVVADVNPRKHGKHVPGTGHVVVPPAQVAELRPDVVLLLNPNYEGEVAGTLSELGLAPRVLAVGR